MQANITQVSASGSHGRWNGKGKGGQGGRWNGKGMGCKEGTGSPDQATYGQGSRRSGKGKGWKGGTQTPDQGKGNTRHAREKGGNGCVSLAKVSQHNSVQTLAQNLLLELDNPQTQAQLLTQALLLSQNNPQALNQVQELALVYPHALSLALSQAMYNPMTLDLFRDSDGKIIDPENSPKFNFVTVRNNGVISDGIDTYINMCFWVSISHLVFLLNTITGAIFTDGYLPSGTDLCDLVKFPYKGTQVDTKQHSQYIQALCDILDIRIALYMVNGIGKNSQWIGRTPGVVFSPKKGQPSRERCLSIASFSGRLCADGKTPSGGHYEAIVSGTADSISLEIKEMYELETRTFNHIPEKTVTKPVAKPVTPSNKNPPHVVHQKHVVAGDNKTPSTVPAPAPVPAPTPVPAPAPVRTPTPVPAKHMSDNKTPTPVPAKHMSDNKTPTPVPAKHMSDIKTPFAVPAPTPVPAKHIPVNKTQVHNMDPRTHSVEERVRALQEEVKNLRDQGITLSKFLVSREIEPGNRHPFLYQIFEKERTVISSLQVIIEDLKLSIVVTEDSIENMEEVIETTLCAGSTAMQASSGSPSIKDPMQNAIRTAIEAMQNAIRAMRSSIAEMEASIKEHTESIEEARRTANKEVHDCLVQIEVQMQVYHDELKRLGK